MPPTSINPSIMLLELLSRALRQGLSPAANARGVLDIDRLADFIAGLEQAVEIVLGVGGGEAEAGAGGDERGGRVTDDDDGDFALEHLVGEGRDFGRVVEQHGDDGGVVHGRRR